VDVRCLMLKQFKRLYNFYFRISAIIFGKQSNEKKEAFKKNPNMKFVHS
jgi:hypothetical protein